MFSLYYGVLVIITTFVPDCLFYLQVKRKSGGKQTKVGQHPNITSCLQIILSSAKVNNIGNIVISSRLMIYSTTPDRGIHVFP